MMYGVNIIWLAGIMNRFFSLSFHSNSKLEFSSLKQKNRKQLIVSLSKPPFNFHFNEMLLKSMICVLEGEELGERGRRARRARRARNLFRFCQSTIVNYSHSALFQAIVLTKTKSARRWKIFIFIIALRFIAFDFCFSFFQCVEMVSLVL